MVATYRGERTEFRKLSAKVTERKQFSASSVFVVLRCATILCPVNSVLSLARVGHRVCHVDVERNTGSRAAPHQRRASTEIQPHVAPLPPTAHIQWRSRGSKSGGADDGRIRLRFMRCRNCTLFLAKFMASASYKYLVSLVSACLLGTQDEAPLIIVAGQFIVHLSAIAISLMPLPGQGPTILSPNPGGR